MVQRPLFGETEVQGGRVACSELQNQYLQEPGPGQSSRARQCSTPVSPGSSQRASSPHLSTLTGPSSSKAWTLPGLDPMENSRRVSQLKRVLSPALHSLLLREASSLET